MSSLIDTTQKKIIAAGIVLVVLLGGIVLAAAGGDEEQAKAETPTTVTSTTTTTVAPTTTTAAPKPAPVAPLTGIGGLHEGRIERPALVVKVDNLEPKARPQVGINQADVVFEERVEGSVTRFLTIFHSTDAAPVGPVRSARTSDIPVLSMLNRPLFAWSGANPTFAHAVRTSNLLDVGYDVQPGRYFRHGGRPRPHNLLVRSTVDLLNQPHEGSAPPLPLFQYRAPGEETKRLEPVRHVRISYGNSAGSAPVEYKWNGQAWLRYQAGTMHLDSDGRQVAPANVIVQFVNYVPTTTGDQYGVPIREAQLVGSGDAWVLTNGGLVPGKWIKPNRETRTRYVDLAGEPIELTPGRTWVALPSSGGAQKLG